MLNKRDPCIYMLFSDIEADKGQQRLMAQTRLKRFQRMLTETEFGMYCSFLSYTYIPLSQGVQEWVNNGCSTSLPCTWMDFTLPFLVTLVLISVESMLSSYSSVQFRGKSKMLLWWCKEKCYIAARLDLWVYAQHLIKKFVTFIQPVHNLEAASRVGK